MARAHRYFLPGYVWHITHRCHKKEFLLKLKRDRRAWLSHLFEAKKRYGLVIFNYMVTSNHIQLLVRSDDEDTISKSMQYIAGRRGQDYNRRKSRKGAYWEDRYHATAVESGEHMLRCMLYIDMNMVRAGVVRHPSEWDECGFKEVLTPRERYSLIHRQGLLSSLELDGQDELRENYPKWLDEVISNDRAKFDDRWSFSVAVGSDSFVETVRSELGLSEMSHQIESDEVGSILREPDAGYGENNWVSLNLDQDDEER